MLSKRVNRREVSFYFFNGKISETKMIKKGTNMFFISGTTFELRVKVMDFIKIIEKIIIEKSNPIIPKDVAISK